MQRSFDKAPFVIGVLDAKGRVRHVSGGVAELLGYQPSECLGRRAVSIVHEDDQWLLRASDTERMELRLRHISGAWMRAAAVITPLHPPETHSVAVVLTVYDQSTMTGLESRVAALEARLRRIALEAVVAGLGESSSPTTLDEETVALLSPRQADIAQRLTAGKRVPTIARDMSLSQSTVRNHLSQIFRKFGVTSQAALIEALQRAPRADRDTAPRSE